MRVGVSPPSWVKDKSSAAFSQIMVSTSASYDPINNTCSGFPCIKNISRLAPVPWRRMRSLNKNRIMLTGYLSSGIQLEEPIEIQPPLLNLELNDKALTRRRWRKISFGWRANLCQPCMYVGKLDNDWGKNLMPSHC
jgi:hypothetical protein